MSVKGSRVTITIDAPGDDKYLLLESLESVTMTLFARRSARKLKGGVYDEDNNRVGKWTAVWEYENE